MSVQPRPRDPRLGWPIERLFVQSQKPSGVARGLRVAELLREGNVDTVGDLVAHGDAELLEKFPALRGGGLARFVTERLAGARLACRGRPPLGARWMVEPTASLPADAHEARHEVLRQLPAAFELDLGSGHAPVWRRRTSRTSGQVAGWVDEDWRVELSPRLWLPPTRRLADALGRAIADSLPDAEILTLTRWQYSFRMVTGVRSWWHDEPAPQRALVSGCDDHDPWAPFATIAAARGELGVRVARLMFRLTLTVPRRAEEVGEYADEADRRLFRARFGRELDY